jgi:transposase
MTLPSSWIGIDISKAWLDVADPALGKIMRIANKPMPLADLAAALAGRDVVVVFEATGSYDAVLRRALDAQDVGRARVNPQHARDFARARGRLAKTDKLDAAMLAAMGRALELEADPPSDQTLEKLALLNKRRDQLVAMRMQERTRLAEVADVDIAGDIERHIAWLSEAITDAEVAIHSLIRASCELARTETLIRSMPGVGPVAAATLIALMPELGRRPNKAIAMLAGLAPLNADSGTKRGQRIIRGGRQRVRQALYMAAVSTLRHGSPLTAFYRKLRDAGKPPKVALIALARKILITLNAMVRSETPFKA